MSDDHRERNRPAVTAFCEVFRLDERGEIVEHGDVLPRVPEVSENQNSMF